MEFIVRNFDFCAELYVKNSYFHKRRKSRHRILACPSPSQKRSKLPSLRLLLTLMFDIVYIVHMKLSIYIYMSVCVRAGAHGLDHRKSEGETSCIVNLKEQGLESE